jgi:hypothetical protein
LVKTASSILKNYPAGWITKRYFFSTRREQARPPGLEIIYYQVKTCFLILCIAQQNSFKKILDPAGAKGHPLDPVQT